MKTIVAAVKEVILSHSPAQNMTEAMMKWDFKTGDPRQNLMQLCFSNLAAWPLAFIFILIAVDPFKYAWTLLQVLGDESAFLMLLLNGHGGTMLLFCGIFFVLEWLFRSEYVLPLVVLYFMNKGELHVHLAFAAMSGMYLARLCYLWWLAVDCESETRSVWNSVGVIQMVTWVLITLAGLSALDYVSVNHLLDGELILNRLGFMAIVLAAYHFLSHLLLSIWGHFYSRRVNDPSFLRTSYSTANWILRFKLSPYLQYLIKRQIEAQLPKHESSHQQMNELKVHNPALSKLNVDVVLKKEIGYLKEASLRISRI